MTDQRRSGANPYDDLTRRTSADGPNRGPLIIGAVVAVVVLAAVVAIVVAASGDNGDSIEAVQEAGPIEVTGEPLAEYPPTDTLSVDPAADPATGATPPVLTGQTFEGDPLTIDPGDGRAKVVVFATHWCPVCQREIPQIREWLDDGGLPDDVDLQLVSTSARSDGPEYPPSDWLGSVGWTEPVLLDNADSLAATSWGLRSYPYLVFVDADGNVNARASGELPTDELERLVAGISPS